MSFSLHEVKSIARDVAREYRPEIEILAVTHAEGGGDSAELLVASACAGGPAELISIHVMRRGTRTEVRASIANGLGRHYASVQHERLAVGV